MSASLRLIRSLVLWSYFLCGWVLRSDCIQRKPNITSRICPLWQTITAAAARTFSLCSSSIEACQRSPYNRSMNFLYLWCMFIGCLRNPPGCLCLIQTHGCGSSLPPQRLSLLSPLSVCPVCVVGRRSRGSGSIYTVTREAPRSVLFNLDFVITICSYSDFLNLFCAHGSFCTCVVLVFFLSFPPSKVCFLVANFSCSKSRQGRGAYWGKVWFVILGYIKKINLIWIL